MTPDDSLWGYFDHPFKTEVLLEFQFCTVFPCCKEAVNIMARLGESSSAISFSNFAGMRSGPVALKGSISLRSLVPLQCLYW